MPGRGLALHDESPDELRGKVLSVGRAAAVAEQQDLPAVLQAFRDQLRGINDLRPQGLGQLDPQLRPVAQPRNDMCECSASFHDSPN